METRWLWILPLVITLAACSPDAGPNPNLGTAPQTVSDSLMLNPTVPGDVSSGAGETDNRPAVRYQRTPREDFLSQDAIAPGQVAFSSVDGSVQCEFRPVEDNPPLNMEPLGNWRLGFSQGACRWGGLNQPDYAVVDTRSEIRPDFTEQQDWINHVMPGSFTPLVPGTYIDLHTMGCFTEHVDEISCMKYETGEAFAISSEGYRQLDEAAMARSLNTSAEVFQVLSPTPVFTLDTGQKISCFRDQIDMTQFFCQSFQTSLWGDEDNIVHFRLVDGRVDMLGSIADNPGNDVYLARQPVSASTALIHSDITVHDNGTRLALRSPDGDAFWVSAGGFGLGD